MHKGNVISGNAWDGIYINHPQATANFVQGNYIGTDASGGQKVGNGYSGIYIYNAPANNIGGLEAGARNIISGNGGAGILIEASGTTGTLIQGNYIGTDLTGALPLGNVGDGVHIQDSASSNLVGGTANGAGNLISGNGWSGVRITAAASGNTVQGNTIGTDPGGTLALGNVEQGVSLNGPDNLVGGTEVGAANRIAHNTGNGIYVETGTGNNLEGNLVWDNAALGIDLGPPGITPNDIGDADSGPNNLQNFPLLTSVSSDGSSTTVEGTLNSTPNTTFRLEFFANTTCNPSGNGEGESYLSSQDVVTDASGNVGFSITLPAGVSGGASVSATATDPGGNTSEFSACRESIAGAYSWHYQYDALYRLTGAYYSDGTYFRYTYDAVGNRLSEETVTGTITYTYDSANRLASVDGVPYTWDNNGNLLSDGLYTYTFNHANQLISVSGAGTTVSYAYNGQGDRISQTAGITTTAYTLDLAAGLTQVLSDGTDTYLYGDGRIAQYDTFGAQYFLGDALGSVRQLVDANGELLLAQSYEPYGSVLESAGEGTSSYGFAAEMRDLTGLIYLRARYYSSSQGRFITKDTWPGDYSRPLSLNGWNYVEADPINFIDPSGLFPLPSEVDELPVRLLDPRSLGYYVGENVDLLPYLFYLDPYDFNFTTSINYSVDDALAERAISTLASKFSSIIGQGDIPNLPGEENYPTKFIIEMLEGKTFWRRLIEVHGSQKNLFSAWFVTNNVKGKNMVAETFPLNSPENFYNVRASVYLNPITQGNNNQIILDSEYMRISFGYTFWLQFRYNCLTIHFPLSIEHTSRLIGTDSYYGVRFSTGQTGDRTVETKGEIRLLEGFNPVGTVTLRGTYIGPEWKLHVIDDKMPPHRK